MTLKEKVLKATEYDASKFEKALAVEDMNSEDRDYLEFLRGEWNENARLRPLLEALAERESEITECLKEIIRDSPDIISKKLCSEVLHNGEALAKLEALLGKEGT
ncbi:MAG: hypothetical protein C4586_05800 [Anaerolineaceae bacterium]|nr:MAG: hypothetical protein C4586_05800 [Anaerolineaceae bacterium]